MPSMPTALAPLLLRLPLPRRWRNALWSLAGIARVSRVNVSGELHIEAPVRLTGITVRGSAEIGAFSYIRGGRLQGNVSIGRYCSIADGVSFGAANHPTTFLSTHPFQYNRKLFAFHRGQSAATVRFKGVRPVRIGSDVWIGRNVMIMPGVNVGDGAIIGAGAIVTRDVPPYAIVAGVPARIVRHRFDEHTVQRLLQLRWWDHDITRIDGIPWDDVPAALAELAARLPGPDAPRWTPPRVRY